MLHVIYRSYGGENKKTRPHYYSKLLALASFIRAFRELDAGSAEVIFLNDGPVASNLLALMETAGEVVPCPRKGLRASVRTALDIPAKRKWPAGDLIWFAEDDYLYQPQALRNLAAAAEACPEAEYFALYATIGDRKPTGDSFNYGLVPPDWQGSEPILVQGQPWRKALTTTGTFGGRVKPVLEDTRAMLAALWTGAAYDHTTCLMLQGYRPYAAASLLKAVTRESNLLRMFRRSAISAVRMGLNGYQMIRIATGAPRRTIMAPDPALITHLETEEMASGSDWTSLARGTQRWLGGGSSLRW